ncbi:MAG: copper-binding protein [Burkholderiales bacterium]|nr:copper-binding protein [Burkholderiales bacterium]
MNRKLKSLVLGVALGAFAGLAAGEEKHHAGTLQAAAASDALADGEIRKVDRDASKITIRHGPIANLDMPAMTMVFKVEDPALLDQVKAGDKVKFVADKIGGAYVVVRFEASPR